MPLNWDFFLVPDYRDLFCDFFSRADAASDYIHAHASAWTNNKRKFVFSSWKEGIKVREIS